MNIQAICEGHPSSTIIMMEAIKRYSKYDIEVRQFNFELNKKPDIIFFVVGNFVNDYRDIIEAHPEVKFFAAITDLANFKRLIGWNFSNQSILNKLSGVIACGEEYYNLCKKYTQDIPLFQYESSVDMTLFTRRPKPKRFSVGMGEKILQYQDDPYFRRFIRYPYPKKTSSEGLGTDRDYSRMPEFYNEISIFIDPTPEERPGGMMFLEAGAVGRPSLAMRSGILTKWFPNEYLVKDDEEMINKIHLLRDDNDYYQSASDKWYNIAQSRDYTVATKEFDAFFDSVMI